MRDARATAFVLAFVAGCASRQPAFDGGAVPAAVVERAIAARGGPLAGLVRTSDVQVAIGFPGAWRWSTVTAIPERYAWSIVTNDQPNHYLFDGTIVRAFVGAAFVSEDPSPSSPLRTHARFAAVANLDILRTPAVQVAMGPPDHDGATLSVVFPDRNDRFEISLDRNDLVTRVSGSIDLSPIARGHLVAVYDDYREADGRRIAYHIHYDLDGTSLADERVIAACIITTTPSANTFASPAHVPTCKKAPT